MKPFSDISSEITVPLMLAAMVYQIGFATFDLMLTGGFSQDLDPSAVFFLFVGLPVTATLIATVLTWFILAVVYVGNRMVGNWASANTVKSISTALGMLPAWYAVGAIMGLENGFTFTYTHIWIAFLVALTMGAVAPTLWNMMSGQQIGQSSGDSIAR